MGMYHKRSQFLTNSREVSNSEKCVIVCEGDMCLLHTPEAVVLGQICMCMYVNHCLN